jgi:hypothetical protein
MTDVEHKEVIAVFTDLWDGIAQKMTNEQWMSWKRVWGAYTVNQAIRALRGLKDTSTKFPEPALLHKRLREERANEKQTGVSTKHKSWEQFHIDRFAEAMPDLRDEIEQMTERDMRVCLLLHDWQMSVKVYGTISRSTISAYWKWQKCIDANAPYSNWSPQAEQAYRQRVQNLEQLEAERVDSPKPWLGHVLRDFFRNQFELVA